MNWYKISPTFERFILVAMKQLHCYTFNCKTVSFTENEIFEKYYSQLIKILPVKNLLYKLVSEQIISLDDIEEINSLTTSEEKCSNILETIAKSLAVGITRSFYALLDIMDNYGGDLKFLAKNIQRNLINNPGNQIHAYSYYVVTYTYLT